MSKTIDFYYDFASPNVYLAGKILPQIAEKTGAEINIIPVLLGGIFKSTGNQAPMIAFAPIKGKVAYEMLEFKRFVERHGLTNFKMNPGFPVNTVALIRGLIVAQTEGFADAYMSAIQKAMWEDEKDVADTSVVIDVLNQANLDGEAITTKTQDPHVKQKLIQNTESAVERGVFGLPTFFVGDEMYFGKERLEQVAEELA